MWPVVPISDGQALDVRPEDLAGRGHFRVCDTYRGGGGYDQFPVIAEARGLGSGLMEQFVVQLLGCTLDCPYCYVTRAEVWGAPVMYDSQQLAKQYNLTGASVFHLMGGAPALYMRNWQDLLAELEKAGRRGWVFHSDLLLNEERRPYDPELLKAITHPRALYAVDIKGWSSGEFRRNTRKEGDPLLMWENLKRLEAAQARFYITFTGVSSGNREEFWDSYAKSHPETASFRKGESFSIDIIEYDAQPHVDDVPWGGK
jgi:pyruvate-formate lyase-activating enzyme